MKQIGIIMMSALVLAGCNTEDYEATISSLEEEVTVLASANEKLTNKNSEISDEKNKVENTYKEYKKRMESYEDLEKSEAEARKIEADKLAKQKEEEEKAKKEAEAKAKKEKEEAEARAEKEKEAQGYETGITYDQLARTPDDFSGKKVKFNGKVVQVLEGPSETQLRFAVNDNYDTMMYLAYDPSIVEQRVLEDDNLTFYGTSMGTITYESTMGGDITIPSAFVDKIDFN